MVMNDVVDGDGDGDGDDNLVMNDALNITDKVFTDWGWSSYLCGNERIVYVYDGDPYNEFMIARNVGGFSVSVPVPNYGIQYRTTMRDFTDACAFLRTHLDYFMKANRGCF